MMSVRIMMITTMTIMMTITKSKAISDKDIGFLLLWFMAIIIINYMYMY